MGRKLLLPELEDCGWLTVAYSQCSIRDIARFLDCSHEIVRQKLHHHGIEVPDRIEAVIASLRKNEHNLWERVRPY